MKGKLWTKQEIKDLTSMWGKTSKKDVCERFPDKSYGAISGKAMRLGLAKPKPQKMWKYWEIEFLKDNYGIMSTKDIAVYLERTYQSIKSMATKRLKLDYGGKCQYGLQPLLSQDNESWYWNGFIAGDGGISSQYLTVLVHEMDINHLQILANKLGTKIRHTNRGYPCIDVSDVCGMEDYKNHIGYGKGPKTYNPLNIKYEIDNNKMLSFIAGFIDADGCIESTKGIFKQLKIEVHGSWLNNLEYISEFLSKNYNIPSRVILNTRGYALLRITKHDNGVTFRNLIKELNIPYLKRKWDKYDDKAKGVNFFYRVKDEVVHRYSRGETLHSIAKSIGVKYGSLYNHKKRIQELSLAINKTIEV